MRKATNQWRIYNVYSREFKYSKLEPLELKSKSIKHSVFDKILNKTAIGLGVKSGLTVLISVLIIYGVVQAGTITPPSGTPSAQFYTLSEIYNFITSNTTATESGHGFTFSDDLSGTGRTLTEIYSSLASLVSADQIKLGTTYLAVDGTLVPSSGDAGVGNVLADKTFFGASQSDWTLQTGTMTNNSSFGLSCSSSDQSVTEGYYSGGTLSGDADLTAGSIKLGVNIFSTSGTYSGYPGSDWTGSGLTESACDSADNWYWFEDGNGDGDTNDPQDGLCVKATTVTSASWNGGEQITPNNLADTAANSGTSDSITDDDAGWTTDAYKNHTVKIVSGTAINCWGKVKANTADTITVYGSWLGTDYSSSCGTPDATSNFQVYDDWGDYDNSFIGDYTCDSVAFPNGSVAFGSYPTSGVMALAEADCYDGTRDLLPNETDRAVISGTATSADATSITDSTSSLNTNAWIGQKVLIISGTGVDSYGYIESNTATAITVTDWLGGADPDVGSVFSIIYIVPHSSYVPDAKIDGDSYDVVNGNNGPLNEEVLNNWKGTKLPNSSDFFGFCGYKDGGSNYESTTGTYTSDKTYGNYGGQVGRTDEFLDLANSSWEWLSEQHSYFSARVAGAYACSYFNTHNVYNSYRFRAVFRP